MDGAKTGDKELTLNFTSNSEANPMKSDQLVIMMTDLESLANPDMYVRPWCMNIRNIHLYLKAIKANSMLGGGVTEARL